MLAPNLLLGAKFFTQGKFKIIDLEGKVLREHSILYLYQKRMTSTSYIRAKIESAVGQKKLRRPKTGVFEICH